MKKKIQNVEIEVIVLEAINTISASVDGYSTQALVGGRYGFDEAGDYDSDEEY